MTPEIPYWFCNEDETVNSEIENQKSGVAVVNPVVNLIRLASGDFQVSQIGEFKSILSGADYILIRHDLAKFLYELLPSELTTRSVKIHRKATGEEWTNYSEISIEREIQFEEYYRLKVEGLRIYKMFDSLIYVSSDVKNEVINHFPNLAGVVFKKGLPIVAG